MQNASKSSPEANRVVVSVNPKAGARSPQTRSDRLVELLRQRDLQVETFTDLEKVAERAIQWYEQGLLRALVGVGGDGTAAELVNRTPQGLPLTMLPAGNENLLARFLGLGESPETICKIITDGNLIRLDVGKANDRIFLLMLGCGLDGDVVERVHRRRTGHIRTWNYFKPILESIRRYKFPELRLFWEEEPHENPVAAPSETGSPAQHAGWAEETPAAVVRWLFAFNLPCYGGGLKIVPQADGMDGLLDICAFDRGSLLSGLKYAAAVYLRRHQRLADCTMARVRRLRITSEAEVPYQLDGDPGGFLPVDVEVVSERLTLVVPSPEPDPVNP